MTDLTDPAGASLRLSNDERERAVAALQAHAAQGRLSDAEVQTRAQSARSAVTRGDLAPLFADLPGHVDLDGAGAGAGAHAGAGADTGPTGGAATGPGTGPAYPAPSYAAQPSHDPYAPPADRSSQPGNRRWGLAVVSVAPFVALILFFVTSSVWGYAYSWLWFLLVPITGAIVYGADGDRYRR